MSRVEVLSSDSDTDEKPPAAQKSQSDQQRSDEDGEGVDSEACNRLKLRGNDLFGKGSIEDAMTMYSAAIRRAPVRPKPAPKDPFPKPRSATASAEGAPDDVPTPAEEPSAAVAPVEDLTDYVLTSQCFCNLGACFMKLDQFELAEKELTESLRHVEAYEKALARRADCYWKLSKWSSAYGDWQALEKLGVSFDSETRARRDEAKRKTDEEMKQMMGQLKNLGNMFLGKFGLSTDNFKFEQQGPGGGYSVKFEK